MPFYRGTPTRWSASKVDFRYSAIKDADFFEWEPPSADEPSMHNGTHRYIDRRLSIMNHLTQSESGISEKREDDFPGSRVSRSCARAVIITPSSFATAKLVSGFFPVSRVSRVAIRYRREIAFRRLPLSVSERG